MKLEISRAKKMTIDVNEVKTVELKPFWVVRVIHDDPKTNVKKCVCEKPFIHEPDAQEIADVLFDYDFNCHFASVVKNYRLKEEEPDFSF